MVEKLFPIFNKTSKRKKGSLRYIGLNVLQTNKEALLTNSCISCLKLVKSNPERASQKDEQLTIAEKSQLGSISGQL